MYMYTHVYTCLLSVYHSMYIVCVGVKYCQHVNYMCKALTCTCTCKCRTFVPVHAHVYYYVEVYRVACARLHVLQNYSFYVHTYYFLMLCQCHSACVVCGLQWICTMYVCSCACRLHIHVHYMLTTVCMYSGYVCSCVY